MSEYKGSFSVTNNTGGTITNVTVQHTTGDWSAGTVTAATLANGASTGQGPVVTSTSQTDYWTVSFVNGVGILTVGSTTCGFESDDNGENVVVALYANNFSIMTPSSKACLNNDYNSQA